MTRRLPLLFLLLTACGEQKVSVYNAPPIVSITAPPDGSSFDEASLVEFSGLVSDNATDPTALLLSWSSDLDGVLSDTETADSAGVALFSTASLSVGNHAITLAATDEQGERAEATVGITIVDVPDNPTLRVVHPASGEAGAEGDAFEFVVQVSDEQQTPDLLRVAFESDVDGAFCSPTPDAVGVASCAYALSAGDHRLTFRVTDADGLTAVEEYVFTVVAGTEIDDDGDGWNETQGDCDDGDRSVNPGATEYYNERDDDCDGVVDDGTVGFDDDGDGQSELDGDCDDASPDAFVGNAESCDGRDNDCDDTVDEGTDCYDDDGDSYAEIAGDCDDASALSYPGAAELEDGRDNDCDSTVDEGTNAYDDDGDGYTENAGDCNDDEPTIRPAGTESCNGYDDDCDGTADEQNASGCFTYYYDYDGDGYGSSSAAGRCLCSMSGSYTAASDTDCYDYNSAANPGATTYRTSPRGDSSYDYNCDTSESKYYTATYSCDVDWTGFSCDSYTSGFSGSSPSCGNPGTWRSGCSADWWSCSHSSTSSVTQACR